MDDHSLMHIDASGYVPLQVTRIGESWNGDKQTNTEAMRLLAELQSWASQFKHDEGKKLGQALGEVEQLFQRVWTEIDESLVRMKLADVDRAGAADHRAAARRYLNRWQDREGRVGNAAVPGTVRQMRAERDEG